MDERYAALPWHVEQADGNPDSRFRQLRHAQTEYGKHRQQFLAEIS
jgi:hypothetical protein